MSSININNYNGSGSTMNVLITEQCVHERELMKSDFIRLHWVSDTYTQLAVGAYISHGGRNYTLLDAYLPNEQSDGSYLYEPEFKAPEYILSRTPLLYSTILYANVSTGEADTGERTWVSEWTTTGLLSTILDYIATYIKEVTNDSTKCSVVITDSVGLKASASCSFSNMDILSGLAEVATQFDGEYMLDLANHKLYFGKSIKIARASACTLKVGSNVNVPSISESKEDYYNVFKVYGSTRNIAAQNSAGEAVQSDARLQLGSGYTDSEIDTRYALDADGKYTLTNGAKLQVKNEPKLTKILTFEDVYPHLKLYVYAPIEVQKYRLDDDKRKIPVYNSDGTPATDSNGNVVFELYSRWFVRLAWYDTQTSKWKDYVYDRANQIADTKLSISFSANEEGTHSALAGREFELTYVSNAYTEESVTGNINITSGYYYINFVEENGIVIPTTSVGGLIPFGEGDTLEELNGGTIDVEENDTATLINLALSADHITSAQGELQVAAWKEIKKELATDTNNYTFDSNPVAFNASNPSLKLGDIVNYVDGSRYPESAPHTTRVLKLVTKLDYSCEEEITIGDAVIKGNTESVQESVARTDNNVNILTSLSEANANILQAYNRTQAAIQQSLARYTQMFDFDTEGNIKTTFNLYSTRAISALGSNLSSGSGSSSSGGVDMVSVWSALLANTNEQISLSHLTTALANYYNKTEVNGLLSQLPKFAIKVVGALPTSDISATTIYLITDTDGEGTNLYKEYIYINNKWELIGAQKTNISNLIAKVDGSNDLLLASGSTITKANLLNGYLKSTDLADWAKATTKPTYTASEVGALPSNTKIPTKVSDLTNDSKYLTSVAYNDLTTKPTQSQIATILGNYVSTFGSKNGAITLRGGLTTSGSVNLAMSNNELQASIVGLGGYAYISNDATHRLVTDTEKSTWNGKQNALTFTSTPSATNRVATESDISELSLKKADKKGSITQIVQIVEENDYTGNIPNWQARNCTASTADDGSLLLTQGSTTEFDVRNYHKNYDYIQGHKYLSIVKVKALKSGITSTPLINYGYLDCLSKVNVPTDDYKYIGYINTAKKSGFYVDLLAFQDASLQGQVALKYCAMFDLTEMFGVGNEPNTLDEFAQALGYSSIEDVPFYPFTKTAIPIGSGVGFGGGAVFGGDVYVNSDKYKGTVGDLSLKVNEVEQKFDADGAANCAAKLKNSRTLWGQTFDGTSDVSGDLSGVGNIIASDNTPLITKSGYAIAIGRYSIGITLGHYSFNAGYYAAASGDYATAIGYIPSATKSYATAIGYKPKASGIGSVSIGAQTESKSTTSIAIGYQAISSNTRAVSIGCGTKTNANYQIVLGGYNEQNANYLFMLGNGTSDTARSNAMTIDFSGNMALSGNSIKIGGATLTYDATNKTLTLTDESGEEITFVASGGVTALGGSDS